MLQLSLLTTLTMIAFAGNSILNRMALADELIAPDVFAALRLTSGAIALALLMGVRQRSLAWVRAGSVTGAAALAVYAVGFSFAYVRIDAGLGALLLFGVVQVTLFAAALLARRETIHATRWLGTGLALVGLAVLVLPGLPGTTVAPSPAFAALMVVSALAWGFYTLAGREAVDPLASTAANFLFATPVALAVWLIVPASLDASPRGVFLALLSGVVTSGLGYALWYFILPQLRTTTAALAQLTVPLLAALGGVLLLGESLTLSFAVAAFLVLSGIGLSLRR